MALKDITEDLEGKGWWGVGLGAVILAPVLFPAVARSLRPVAKGAVKGYLNLQDRTKGWLAERGEQWQDLVAEARSEYESRGTGEMMTMELPGEERAGGERPPGENLGAGAAPEAAEGTAEEGGAGEEGSRGRRGRRSAGPEAEAA